MAIQGTCGDVHLSCQGRGTQGGQAALSDDPEDCLDVSSRRSAAGFLVVTFMLNMISNLLLTVHGGAQIVGGEVPGNGKPRKTLPNR